MRVLVDDLRRHLDLPADASEAAVRASLAVDDATFDAYEAASFPDLVRASGARSLSITAADHGKPEATMRESILRSSPEVLGH